MKQFKIKDGEVYFGEPTSDMELVGFDDDNGLVRLSRKFSQLIAYGVLQKMGDWCHTLWEIYQRTGGDLTIRADLDDIEVSLTVSMHAIVYDITRLIRTGKLELDPQREVKQDEVCNETQGHPSEE